MLDEVLKTKEAILLDAKVKLKEKFVGIDDVIDQFIDSVRVWFLMPELMIRPIVVNLWGLTGSGKTDLVRTFARLIKMSNSFVELQMDTQSSIEKIQQVIECADVKPHEPSILLLDEIQRFRTIDEGGSEIQSKKLQDIWMLLSDGKFQSASDKKKEINEILFEDLFWSSNKDDDEDEAEDEDVSSKKLTFTDKPLTISGSTASTPKKKKKISKYKQSYWSAQRLQKLLNYTGSLDDVMQWDHKTKIEKVQESLENDSTFEGVSYSKMLIIIAGNIDEAYKMSTDVSNADVDADIFHEFSKKINIVHIKDALASKFKPEQVARFGNNHIIYPSLNKANYEQIIKNNVNDTIKRVYDLHKINVITHPSVFDTIYKNGVFPAQGVRPVISTISSIFDNYLPNFLFRAIENDINTVHVEFFENEIIGTVGDEKIICKVELSISKIKSEKDFDESVSVSVHEAGHILTYALLFGVTPNQMKSITSNTTNEGFVGVHKYSVNKRMIKNEIIVCLAGQAAEEFVFGDGFQSGGAALDISRATTLAANYIRAYGFDWFQSRVVTQNSQSGDVYNTSADATNAKIEEMLKKSKIQATCLIDSNKSLFKDISQKLIDLGEIKPNELVTLFKTHNKDLIEIPINKHVVENYSDKWKEFLNR
jgi:cell division protease FtsH